jgi:Haem-NO-binding
VHGLILVALRDYLHASLSGEVEREVLADAPVHLVSEAYPDEQFDALVGHAVARTGHTRETLLEEFGAFTAERTFARLYPDLFNVSSSARAFLLTVERPIHELVRVALPNAQPPELGVVERGEQGVLITYTSPRRLCSFLTGLVHGTARHYGELARIDERTCMRRGDAACVFDVRFARDPHRVHESVTRTTHLVRPGD